jgi:acetylornithine deacetylase/succinyl-diaminopimelate desuccinylase-like protein
LEGLTRGRTGRAVFQVTFKGRAAHVARYKEAVDAIEMAANWVTKLYSVRETLFTSPRTVTLVRKFQAEAVGMSICADALLEVEVQAGSSDSFDDVRTKLLGLEPGNDRIQIELKPRVTPYLPGYFFESFPHQEKIATIIKETTGKEMKLHERSSVGDDNAIATLGIPVITWGPDGGNAHNTGEWVSLSSLATLSEMYKKVLDQIG